MYFWILKWKIAASRFLKQLLHTYELLTKCEVKMAGYWPSSFFCVFMDRDEVEVHKFAKKERGQYPAILTSHLVNKGFTLRLFGKFCLRDTAGSPERAISLHLALSGSESQRAISFILPARGASHIINPGYCSVSFLPVRTSHWECGSNFICRYSQKFSEASPFPH